MLASVARHTTHRLPNAPWFVGAKTRARCSHAGLGLRVLLLVIVPVLGGCQLLAPTPGDAPTRLFVVADRADDSADLALLRRHAPAIRSESDWAAWNRPGALELSRNENDELVLRVDPTDPTLYGEARVFTAASGHHYRNLIYRTHFERVPHRLKPFHITAGKNGGLFFVITIDDNDEPLLITTVHSCGCYLAFLPTDRLTKEQLPPMWSIDEQVVFEERLPGQLAGPEVDVPGMRLVLTLRDGTHRVADAAYENLIAATPTHTRLWHELLSLEPLAKLDAMPVRGGGTASVFDDDDYLHNAQKPLELLLMSWWALDPRVGVDKRLGRDADEGRSFYTSIKPWNRQASDMRRFGDFLTHWGFRL